MTHIIIKRAHPHRHQNDLCTIACRGLVFTSRRQLFLVWWHHFTYSMLRNSQRDPEVFFWPRVFWEAWGTPAKKPHTFQKRVFFWLCRLRRQGQQTSCFWKRYGFLALVPQAPQKHFAPKTLRDPFDNSASGPEIGPPGRILAGLLPGKH